MTYVSPSWMPRNAAAHGFAFDQWMLWNLVAVTACFVIAHFFIALVFLRRPRSSSGGDVSRTWRWQAIPLTLLCMMYLAMAVAAQRLWAANRFQGAARQSMQVEVTGRQFQWYFRYPGPNGNFGKTDPALIRPANGNPLGTVPDDEQGRDDIVASELVLPVGREVDLTIRAQDVVHGFFVPAMRLKQNAVPGMPMHVHFTPVSKGVFPILCTQVCGLGHARMQARLRVVDEAEFRNWLQSKAIAR